MQELNSGHFLGSDITNRNIGGIWTSLARYEETLRFRNTNHNDWHFHQNPHFSFILEGGSIERRKTFSAESRAGQIHFYRAGEPHQNVKVLYPSKNFNVEIDAEFLSKYDLDESAVESVTGAANFFDLKFAMLRVYKEAVCHTEMCEMEVHSLILELIAKNKKNARRQFQPPRWMDKVIQILRDRWDENLSLQKLSESSGVHPVTISKHFPKYFSCTLGEYVRRIRIEKSLALIRQSSDSLTDIAHRCGFADQSHFTRVFKDLTGLKPNSFRKI